MKQTYEVISGGKKRIVTLEGFGLQRFSTSCYVVTIDGRRELSTQNQLEAIRYISDLFDDPAKTYRRFNRKGNDCTMTVPGGGK